MIHTKNLNSDVLTTDAISRNFLHQDLETGIDYNYTELKKIVGYFKKVLADHGAQPANTIGLGYNRVDIHYYGAVFAALEMGLRLIVLEMAEHAPVNNPKTEMFFPLDFFMQGPKVPLERQDYFRKNSRCYIEPHTWQDSDTGLDYVLAKDNEVVLVCTSSGTTGKPKRLEHTHAFLHAIAKRNTEIFRFEGRVMHFRTLHHGSSLAVFFLPSLMSDMCTGHYFYGPEETLEDPLKHKIEYMIEHDINYAQFPYRGHLEDFLKSCVRVGAKFRNLTVHTLQYIDPAWQPLIDACGNLKIVSIFGCNETTGPLLINQTQSGQSKFDMKRFDKIDDFYKFSVNHNKQLEVTLPVYNTTVVLQDLFEQHGSQFVHQGRSDLIRINDIELDFSWLTNLCNSVNIGGQIVVDKDHSQLYLAIWSGDIAVLKNTVNNLIHEKYGTSVSIDQVQYLDHDSFHHGIKLDHELLRQEFRKHTTA
jgi:acyl-CoA synthetase (AMP-forming)/AMP-acid ligase II